MKVKNRIYEAWSAFRDNAYVDPALLILGHTVYSELQHEILDAFSKGTETNTFMIVLVNQIKEKRFTQYQGMEIFIDFVNKDRVEIFGK